MAMKFGLYVARFRRHETVGHPPSDCPRQEYQTQMAGGPNDFEIEGGQHKVLSCKLNTLFCLKLNTTL